MNWDSHDRNNAYAVYDEDYCRRAADALGEALRLTEETGRYALMPMDKYNDITLVYNSSTLPGGTETILQENIMDYQGRWSWNMNTDFRPQNHIGAGIKCYPTANYSNYFGMANGYPIENSAVKDRESGYDPEYPWSGRDPRFYKNYVIDGEFCGDGGSGLEASLFHRGADREGANLRKDATPASSMLNSA